MIKEVLLRRNFFLLALGQIISQFGDKLFHMVLVSLMGHCAQSLAKALFFMALPACITPIAGVYTDKWDEKKVMIITDILRAIIILLIINLYKDVVFLYLLIFLLFTASKFFAPARSAIIPQLVEKHQLIAANSISIASIMLTTIVSITISGIIIQKIGIKPTFFINSLTYLLSGLCIYLIIHRPIKNNSFNFSIYQQLKDGLKIILKDIKLRNICIIFMILCLVLSSLYIVGIAYLRGVRQLNMQELGILGGILGVGIMIGMSTTPMMEKKLNRLYIVVLAFLTLGLGIFFLSIMDNFLSLGGIIFFSGLVCPIIPAIVYTVVHEFCPQTHYGRVFGSLDFLGNLSFLVATIIIGFLTYFVRVEIILKCIGAGLMVYALFFLFLKHNLFK